MLLLLFTHTSFSLQLLTRHIGPFPRHNKTSYEYILSHPSLHLSSLCISQQTSVLWTPGPSLPFGRSEPRRSSSSSWGTHPPSWEMAKAPRPHSWGSPGSHVHRGTNPTEVCYFSRNGKKWLCETEVVQLAGFSTGNLFWDLGGGLLNLHSWKELLMISLHGYQCPGPNSPYALGLLIS